MQVFLRVENLSKSTVLGENIKIADSSLRRMVGLLGTSHLEPQSGLLIFPTQGVHTFGMKYPIDVVFLDRGRRVVGIRSAIKPWRLSPIFWRAECVVELPAGVIAATRTEVGDQLSWGAERRQGS
jgi:uncharacterized membrane protein (UPF0127 family)